MIKLCLFFLLCLSADLFAETPTEPLVDRALVGTWSNNQEGNIMGLTVNADSSCEIFVERPLKARSIKKCRFEPFEDSYSVFMYNEHGVCNFSPDFEFSFDAAAPLVYFKVGYNPPIILSKRQTK